MGVLKRCVRARRILKDPVVFARSIGVQIGDNCRLLDTTAYTFGSEPYLIKLGNHVTITSGVKFVTHDGGVWVFRDKYPDVDIIAPITIGNNVFIGFDVLVLPGVTIGDNCVIGAGSVVTRDIPSGTVAAGIPARPLKTVDEYWDKIKDKAFHIRSLPRDEKRRLLVDRFWGQGSSS